ncbi:MAG TPA: hypothetical protein VKW76_08505 [Candidatus Binatia bacterium]|nr:hypothetical protein [Candidatus Binatia bacterium]
MRSHALLVCAAAAAALLAPPPTAHGAIVVCQRKSRVTLRPDTCKKKETQVTLGGTSVPSVPTADSANNANKLGGLGPSAFEPALTHVPLTQIASGDEMVAGTVGPFQIILSCNAGAPGRAALGIRNVSEPHAVANSSDDDDDDFNPGETIYFDYSDAGDAGFAVAPSGWAVQVGGLGGTADAAARTSIANNKCLIWGTYFVIAHP